MFRAVDALCRTMNMIELSSLISFLNKCCQIAVPVWWGRMSPPHIVYKTDPADILYIRTKQPLSFADSQKTMSTDTNELCSCQRKSLFACKCKWPVLSRTKLKMHTQKTQGNACAASHYLWMQEGKLFFKFVAFCVHPRHWAWHKRNL